MPTANLLRYSAVYTNVFYRKLVLYSLTIAAFVATALPISFGARDLNATGYVSHTFWGVSILDPIIYIIAGVATFTFKLRQAQESIKLTGSELSNLELANNVIMCFDLAVCITAVAVVMSLDVATNYYVVPVTSFLTCLWTLGENSFEIVTDIVGSGKVVNEQTALHRQLTSRGKQVSAHKPGVTTLDRDAPSVKKTADDGV
ncbi:hypothetical protein HDU88_008406 [Geranomyces variabilis]|nr:hypothetical protein HDU88_008406 [Geranomyces variabilis]